MPTRSSAGFATSARLVNVRLPVTVTSAVSARCMTTSSRGVTEEPISIWRRTLAKLTSVNAMSHWPGARLSKRYSPRASVTVPTVPTARGGRRGRRAQLDRHAGQHAPGFVAHNAGEKHEKNQMHSVASIYLRATGENGWDRAPDSERHDGRDKITRVNGEAAQDAGSSSSPACCSRPRSARTTSRIRSSTCASGRRAIG